MTFDLEDAPSASPSVIPCGGSAVAADPCRVAIVAAMDERGVIGRGGSLPWRIPSDLRRFKEITMGKPVVMGRRTYLSLGRSLVGRTNVVLSRDPGFEAVGASVVGGLAEALAVARASAAAEGATEACVIGGAEVFRLSLPVADRLCLTTVLARVEGDVFFPPFDEVEWETVRESGACEAGDEFPTVYRVLERARRVRAPVAI